MPVRTPASCMTCSASPNRSRASSVENVSLTMGATVRWALGKRLSPGCALQESSRSAASAAALFHILDLDRFAGHALRQSRGHEPVEIPVEDVARRRGSDAGAEVLHQLIGLQHVRTDLMAPADVGLRGIGGAGFSLALLELGFVKPRLQLLERRSAVLVLRPLVLAGDDDPCRDVGDPDRAIGRVDVLPTRARSAVSVDTQVRFVDLDVDVIVNFGIDPDARETGVPSRVGIVGADSNQAMDTAFGLEIAVGVLALDQDGCGLDPRLLTRMMVDHFDLEAVTLGPTRVHAEQHFGPILAFGPAGAGVDLDIGAVGIRFAREECRYLVAVGALG